MQGGHITLNLGNEYNPTVLKRRSLWRRWNQLSRLQKNLLVTLGAFTLFIFLFVMKSDEPKLIVVEESKVEDPRDEGLSDYNNKETSSAKPLHTPRLIEIIANKLAVSTESVNSVKAYEADSRAEVEVEMSAKKAPQGVDFSTNWNPRQAAVVEAFQHAWKGYKTYAWGHDNLKPLSKGRYDWFHLGLTIVDSLDTMYIMGLKEEFDEGTEWIRTGLTFKEFNDVNLFEVTIRVLGGLLSAYHLSGNPLFLDKSVDLGERLLPCFTRSPSPVPYSDVNLATRLAHSPRWGPDSSTSEVTTIQLEFRELSRSSKLSKFEEPAAKVSEHVHKLQKMDGLVPVFINPKTGLFQNYADIKLGARGDSYYEYLVKQWIQTGKTIDYLKEDYLMAVEGIQKHLVKRTPKENLLFIGELKGGTGDFVPKMDHLVCYLPGTLALGYHHGLPKSHLDLASELLYTCYRTYSDRPTFLAPEITYFNLQDDGKGDMYVKSNDAHNLLRPEFIESLWYMYAITGNATFQDWGWTIFKSFEKYTKVNDGYTSIGNVNNRVDVRPKDMMESFFLGETLKYFYLLFADDRKVLDLDKYVFNSEAHPLPIHSS